MRQQQPKCRVVGIQLPWEAHPRNALCLKKKKTRQQQRERSVSAHFIIEKKKRKAVLPRTRTSLKTSVQHGKTLTRKGREARTSAL